MLLCIIFREKNVVLKLKDLLKVFFMTSLKKCMSSYLKILSTFQDLRMHKPSILGKPFREKKWLESLLGVIVSLRNSLVNNSSISRF